MHVDQKFRTKSAERGSCALYVENSLNGHFVVGGADEEMITRTAEFLNNLTAKPGYKLDMAKNNLGYEPGVVFDKHIAKTVFEWDVSNGETNKWNPRGLYVTNPRDENDSIHDMPYFSTELVDAWMVAEHMVRRAKRHVAGQLGSPEWRAYVSYIRTVQFYQLDAQDAAFIICICASQAISETTQK